MTRLLVFAVLFLCGCFSFDRNVISICEVDGSNDHRIFRIASVTKLMMEPVFWKLEDLGKIDFDQPVTRVLKNRLPEEFETVTLRDLRENRSGLPREFIDPWSLGDATTALACGLFGTDLYADFATRAAFVRKLWDPRVRGDVRRRKPCYSNMGFALLMMAIEDETNETVDALCQRYLIEPYGLKDTTFRTLPSGFADRLTPACAGQLPWFLPKGVLIPEHRDNIIAMYAGGMLSSASDILRVCFVILPHLDRAKGVLEPHWLPGGRKIYYRNAMIYGGHAFVGFDPVDSHAIVLLTNTTCWDSDEGFALLQSLASAERL